MAHIFISYSHKDTEYAHKLADVLQSEGFDIWIDARLDYGSQWPMEIQRQLDDCSAFILIMSPRAYQSEWVQSELSRAKRKNKPIFPLLLEGDEPWLSVESTQYYDVHENKIPDNKFFSALGRVVSRHPSVPTINEEKSGTELKPLVPLKPEVKTDFVIQGEEKKPSPTIGKTFEKKQEKPKSKKEFQLPKIFNKTGVGIVGFIVLALIAVFSLRPLIGMPEPTLTPTRTATFTPIPATNTIRPKTSTPIPATNTIRSKTSTPIPATNTVIPETSTPIPATIALPTYFPSTQEYLVYPKICIYRVSSSSYSLQTIARSFHKSYNPLKPNTTYYYCKWDNLNCMKGTLVAPFNLAIGGDIIIPATSAAICESGGGFVWTQE
jgi:hypothetical protein